jgi:uncharacterized cupin superfamily protein
MKPGSPKALFSGCRILASTRQDEFVYILEGHPTLKEVLYLEVGDRTPGDAGIYPDDDLQAVLGTDGRWRFTRKDGTAY